MECMLSMTITLISGKDNNNNIRLLETTDKPQSLDKQCKRKCK
jgi:hypothetical protein